jgi:hypothetical protein
MSARRHRQLRRRDLAFLGWIAATLLGIGGYLLEGGGPDAREAGGWRHIDRAALEARIGSGELSGREADWYRVIRK